MVKKGAPARRRIVGEEAQGYHPVGRDRLPYVASTAPRTLASISSPAPSWRACSKHSKGCCSVTDVLVIRGKIIARIGFQSKKGAFGPECGPARPADPGSPAPRGASGAIARRRVGGLAR